jgi:hypothetical protein
MVIEILNIINQYSTFLTAIATFAMAMIVYHYNRKLLQLYKKDRERPAIVELIRFFIVPLKEWFSAQMNKDTGEFEEFRIENLKIFPINSNLGKTHALQSLSTLYLRILYIDFNSLLEKLYLEKEKKLYLKKEWDEKVQKYNKLTDALNKKINELVDNVRKFLDENQDVKRVYNATEANKIYSSFDFFKNKLAEKFYQQYRNYLRGIALDDPWRYAGKEIFEQVISHNKLLLEEIEKLKEERKCVLEKLISLLKHLQEQLRKEYNLTSSDQLSPITFVPPMPGMTF